ncbi:MAG: hypothetical protein AMXMBFR13_38720 [Phycisphaerae bacterium]
MAGAAAISAGGTVVGYAALPSADFHAFRWDSSLQELVPLMGDTQSHAMAVDNLGTAVGVSYLMGAINPHAARWQSALPVALGTFAPRAMNEVGTVIGHTSTAMSGRGWVDRACRFADGSLTLLPTLGGSFSYASGVNDAGQIVGMSHTTADDLRRACMWWNDQPSDLGTLGGANSQAYAINAPGQVVGISDTVAGQPHAFLYTLNGSGQVLSRADLGELGGGYSAAYALNSFGEVVGTSDSRAFYWHQDGMVDLARRIPPGSGWVLSAGAAINEGGQIAGTGYYQGWPQVFVLTPVAPDYDHDGDVDQEDFGHFQLCYTGSGVSQEDPNCWNALLDGDDAVDGDDFDVFQRCSNGPSVPADPGCWR